MASVGRPDPTGADPESDMQILITNIGVLLDWPAAYTPNAGSMDAFLLVQLILILLPGGFFEWLGRVLDKLVGTPLIVLGTICALILGVWWWLRRIARQATSFYAQVALAQFLPLTESIKGRFLDRDAALLTRRVVAPESLLRGDDPEADTTARRARFAEGVRAWLDFTLDDGADTHAMGSVLSLDACSVDLHAEVVSPKPIFRPRAKIPKA